MDGTPPVVTAHPSRLELRAAGRTWHATAGRRWTIGRAPQADVHLDNPLVSRHHAVLELTPTGWVLVNRSPNGMFVNGRRIEAVNVRQPVSVMLGSISSGEMLQLCPAVEPAVAPGASEAGTGRPRRDATTIVHPVDQAVITIGRAPDNTVELADLLVSRHHAVLRQTSTGWELVDRGSANGTYVNGARISRAVIGPDDIVGIGHGLLHLTDQGLVAYADTGDVSYAASGLRVVTKKGRVLLADVGFALPQRSLLAVVGPSGAGKSTLLNALTGFRPANFGQVHYDDRDLYDNYAELRHRIGFVPQDDILHTALTVRTALDYAARLRFPQDVSVTERHHRIDEVLAELGLTEQADQRIDSLSGGQRKRTSVALELLTKPSLLFLDEPTSGLDPGYEKSVMQTLRGLADGGRSVVVVTHTIAQLNICDRVLILAPGGRLAYFGPPQHALTYFDCEDFADLFMLLEQDTTTDWTGRFKATPLHDVFSSPRVPIPGQPAAMPALQQKPTRQQSALAQFAILCRRYLAVIAADRPYAAYLLILPLVLGLFTHAAPGTAGLSMKALKDDFSFQPQQVLTLLIIFGAFMGCAVSIREIVKERAIYLREHAIGLSRGAYVASKVVVLSALTSVQGLAMGLLGVAFLRPPDKPLLLRASMVEIAIPVVAVTVTSMLIGLLISALIANADRAMPLLVLVVMAQLVLCGGLFPVHGFPREQLAWLSPSRWTFAMDASTVGLNKLRHDILGQPADPLWVATRGQWLTDLGYCAALAAALIVILVVCLGLRDPHRKGHR